MLIILDRDGVINEDSDEYIKSSEEWIPIPGSLAAIAKLNQAGYKVAVASNQSGLARGYFTQKDLEDMHAKMQQELAKLGGHVDAIFYCPHHPDDNCDCRKPKPGLLLQIAKKLNTNLENAVFIGDTLSDFQCAKNAGCHFILVKTGKGMRTLAKNPDLKEVPVFENLIEAVEFILNEGFL
jgi:D-glycero-D-manno-heptose 1,7-bisphosphate phosphatase